MDKIEYTLIRSNRKTAEIQVKPEGVIVRVPYRASEKEIREFVESKYEWIKKHMAILEKQRREQSQIVPYTSEEIRTLAEKALAYIPKRVKYYAPLVGVDYGRITIRKQKSRWGSCSSKGNLNFNCLLMLLPEDVIDSVVVHELCHRKHMNHSVAFYREIERVFPEYQRCNKWLKENGGAYLRRLS